jgi:hypothetical protein
MSYRPTWKQPTKKLRSIIDLTSDEQNWTWQLRKYKHANSRSVGLEDRYIYRG